MDALLSFLNQHLDLAALGTSAAVIVATMLAVAFFRRFMKRWLAHGAARLPLTPAAYGTLLRIGAALLWLVAVLLILDAWGIGPAGLWGVLVSAVAVIGVGFLATWSIVSNLTAGLFLTIWRPFRTGDTVIVLPENAKGRVEERNLMFTTLREEDGGVLTVPNNFFFQKLFRVSSERMPGA